MLILSKGLTLEAKFPIEFLGAIVLHVVGL